jgi:hypothetical protein
MDLTIANNRTCASIPGHSLCLDYQLPAVGKLFERFLQQHPRIPDYKYCSLLKNPYGPISTISCSGGSHYVIAEQSKNVVTHQVELEISLTEDKGGGKRHIERLECDKNNCEASIFEVHSINNIDSFRYSFGRDLGLIECTESLTDKSNQRIDKIVPCDGDPSLFDEHLKHSKISLPQPLPPPNPPPPPQGQNTQTGGAPSGSTTSQNTSYFQTGLGAAGTIYFSYKAYQEMEKMDEEGRRAEATSRQAANTERKASGYRALGYVVAAIAAGAFTYYSIRL